MFNYQAHFSLITEEEWPQMTNKQCLSLVVVYYIVS